MATEMKRRQFLTAFAATTGATVLAACAPQVVKETVVVEKIVRETVVEERVVKEAVEVEKEVTRLVEQPEEMAQPAQKDPITLTVSHRAGIVAVTPGMTTRPAAVFMLENPHVTIEWVEIPENEYDAKLITMAAAGTIPDVVFTSDTWTDHTRMVKLGVLRSIDDQLDARGLSKDEWIPGAVEGLHYEGKMYGVPMTCHPGQCFIYVNDDMFAAAGLPVPDAYGNSHQDVMEWAEKLAKGPENDREIYGFSPVIGLQALHNGVRSFGTYENNDAGSECLADNDQWWEWAQWFVYFYKKHLGALDAALPTGGNQTLFMSGKVASVLEGRSLYARCQVGIPQQERPFAWSVIQMPRVPEAKGWGAYINTHAATVATKHPDEAFQYCYFIGGPVTTVFVAQDQGYLTARTDTLQTLRGMMTPFLELQYQCMVESERVRQPDNCRGREVWTVYHNELDKLVTGQEELTRDFMKRLKTAVDEVLQKPF